MLGERHPDRRKNVLERLRLKGNTTFNIAELAHVAGFREYEHQSAHVLAHRMVQSGQLVRVDHGLYALPEKPAGVLSRFHWRVNANHFQLSHRTAMSLHGYGPPLPHAELVVTVDEAKRNRPLTDEIRLRFVKRHATEHGDPVQMDVPGIGRLPVADAETTLLEGMIAPELCGGLLAVCGFLVSRQGQWNAESLIKRVKRLGADSIGRRLGLLFEWSGDSMATQLEPLLPYKNSAVASLDPEGRRIGKLERRWRIRINLPREDVLAALGKGPAPSSAV